MKIKNFKTFINENVHNDENIHNDENKIKDFVEKNSYFNYEGKQDDILEFSTRKNGNVSSETASQLDIKEGKNISKKIKKMFPDYSVSLEVVDEWVLLFVKKYEYKEDEYQYIFKKDLDGSGFSDSFDSIEDLINKYGDWIDVDWNDITEKVEKINNFPIDKFNGEQQSYPLLIKKAGEEGNDWGYNFYIIKSKED